MLLRAPDDGMTLKCIGVSPKWGWREVWGSAGRGVIATPSLKSVGNEGQCTGPSDLDGGQHKSTSCCMSKTLLGDRSGARKPENVANAQNGSLNMCSRGFVICMVSDSSRLVALL